MKRSQAKLIKDGLLLSRAIVLSEDEEMKILAQYLNTLCVLWFFTGSERKCSPQYGAKLKAMGVKKGVPDVLIFEPNGFSSGLAIELKRSDGGKGPTKEQIEWLEALHDRGWAPQVCNGAVEAIGVVNRYLKTRKS